MRCCCTVFPRPTSPLSAPHKRPEGGSHQEFTLRPTGPSSRFLFLCLVPSRRPPACFPRGSASPFAKCPLGSAEAATAPALASRSPPVPGLQWAQSRQGRRRRAAGPPRPPAQPPQSGPGSLRCQGISPPEHRRLDTLTSSFPGASEPGVFPGHTEPLHPSGASTLCPRPTAPAHASEDGDVCGRCGTGPRWQGGWEAGSGGRRSWCSQRIPDPQGSAALGLPRPPAPPGGKRSRLRSRKPACFCITSRTPRSRASCWVLSYSRGTVHGSPQEGQKGGT